MDIDERMDRLTGIVESLAAAVVGHDNQIGGLIRVAEQDHQEILELNRAIAELRRSMAETDRLWQAYLKRLPPQ